MVRRIQNLVRGIWPSKSRWISKFVLRSDGSGHVSCSLSSFMVHLRFKYSNNEKRVPSRTSYTRWYETNEIETIRGTVFARVRKSLPRSRQQSTRSRITSYLLAFPLGWIVIFRGSPSKRAHRNEERSFPFNRGKIYERAPLELYPFGFHSREIAFEFPSAPPVRVINF